MMALAYWYTIAHGPRELDGSPIKSSTLPRTRRVISETNPQTSERKASARGRAVPFLSRWRRQPSVSRSGC
jgi:hypothetical protein